MSEPPTIRACREDGELFVSVIDLRAYLVYCAEQVPKHATAMRLLDERLMVAIVNREED